MKITEIVDHPMKDSWRPGEVAYFEYHCMQSHDSGDAQAWYRSQQPVTIVSIVEPGYGSTPDERLNNGQPRVYLVRFQDGHEHDVFEDELLLTPKHYQRRFCPPPNKQRYIQ